MQVVRRTCCADVAHKHFGGVWRPSARLLHHQGPPSVLFAIQMPNGPDKHGKHGFDGMKLVCALTRESHCGNKARYLSAAPSPFRVTKAYCRSKEQVLISPYGAKSLVSSSCVASKGRFPTNNFTFSKLISVSKEHLQKQKRKHNDVKTMFSFGRRHRPTLARKHEASEFANSSATNFFF